MSQKHFANTGQILQLIVASIGTIITGINAYPSIKTWDFANVWPLLFYLLVAALVLAILNLSRSNKATPGPSSAPSAAPPPVASSSNPIAVYVDQTGISDRLPNTALRYKLAGARQQLTLRLGERWTYGSGTEAIRIVLHRLDTTGPTVRADITVDTFRDMYGGSLTTKNSDELYRFLVPASVGAQTPSSLVALSHSEKFLYFDVVTVTHINEHSGEVELTIVRVLGAAINPAKS
jgi:hypothetical protein